MSSNDSQSGNTTNKPITDDSSPVNGSRDISSIEQDISRLSAILSGPTLSGANAENDLDEASLAELFKQLEGAAGVMNGVEDKLDNILGNLDNLLAALEEKNAQKEKNGAKDESEQGSK